MHALCFSTVKNYEIGFKFTFAVFLFSLPSATDFILQILVSRDETEEEEGVTEITDLGELPFRITWLVSFGVSYRVPR